VAMELAITRYPLGIRQSTAHPLRPATTKPHGVPLPLPFSETYSLFMTLGSCFTDPPR
jgi:hypothetical protein